MIIPVRCFSCGKVIAHKWEEFQTELSMMEEGQDVGPLLDKIGFTRYCCRRMFLSHVDLIDKLLNYNIHKSSEIWFSYPHSDDIVCFGWTRADYYTLRYKLYLCDWYDVLLLDKGKFWCPKWTNIRRYTVKCLFSGSLRSWVSENLRIRLDSRYMNLCFRTVCLSDRFLRVIDGSGLFLYFLVRRRPVNEGVVLFQFYCRFTWFLLAVFMFCSKFTIGSGKDWSVIVSSGWVTGWANIHTLGSTITHTILNFIFSSNLFIIY